MDHNAPKSPRRRDRRSTIQRLADDVWLWETGGATAASAAATADSTVGRGAAEGPYVQGGMEGE